jgi:hypothetical protein
LQTHKDDLLAAGMLHSYPSHVSWFATVRLRLGPKELSNGVPQAGVLGVVQDLTPHKSNSKNRQLNDIKWIIIMGSLDIFIKMY